MMVNATTSEWRLSGNARTLWTALEQVNVPTTSLHDLYYRQISIYRSHFLPHEQKSLRSEFVRVKKRILKNRPMNYESSGFRDEYTMMLLDFVIMYLGLSENSQSTSMRDQQIELDTLLEKLTKAGLQNSNLMALCCNLKGIMYHFQNEMEKAIEQYSKAISICSTFVVAIQNRAVSLQRMDKQDQSLQDDTTAIQMDPNYAPAYNNRGNTYFFNSDWDKALADYTKTISLDRFHCDAYFNRALVYQRKGEMVRALVDASYATQLKPQYVHAKTILSMTRETVLDKCSDHLLF